MRISSVALFTLVLSSCRGAEQPEPNPPSAQLSASPAPTASAEAPPAPSASAGDDACNIIQTRFRGALRGASNRCKDDGGCACYNPVVGEAGCGGITDAATATKLSTLEAEFHAKNCPWPHQCAAQACSPKCTAGVCGSASARFTAADSPEQAWKRLLEAMQRRDEASILRLTTAKGFASLERALSPDDDRAERFAQLGKGWSQWEIRWKARSADKATASLGPEVKEHGLELVKSADGWRLEQWLPGE